MRTCAVSFGGAIPQVALISAVQVQKVHNFSMPTSVMAGCYNDLEQTNSHRHRISPRGGKNGERVGLT
jgi:hypothetical protein